MPDAFAFDIPELNEIGSMMDDLVTPPSSPNTAERPERRTNRRRGSRLRRFGSWTISQIADGTNWKNAAGFRSSLMTDSANGRTRLGAVTLGTYGESVNWRNALDGPQLVLATGSTSPDSGPPVTVEGFFDGMSFE